MYVNVLMSVQGLNTLLVMFECTREKNTALKLLQSKGLSVHLIMVYVIILKVFFQFDI